MNPLHILRIGMLVGGVVLLVMTGWLWRVAPAAGTCSAVGLVSFYNVDHFEFAWVDSQGQVTAFAHQPIEQSLYDFEAEWLPDLQVVMLINRYAEGASGILWPSGRVRHYRLLPYPRILGADGATQHILLSFNDYATGDFIVYQVGRDDARREVVDTFSSVVSWQHARVVESGAALNHVFERYDDDATTTWWLWPSFDAPLQRLPIAPYTVAFNGWSADRQWVIFRGSGYEPTVPKETVIRVRAADGYMQQVQFPAGVRLWQWSPSSAWVLGVAEYADGQLYALDWSGTLVTVPLERAGEDYGVDVVAWLDEDSVLLAFIDPITLLPHLARLELAEGRLTRYDHPPLANFTWLPLHQQVIAVHDRADALELMRFDPATATTTSLLIDDWQAGLPIMVSPCEDALVFHHWRASRMATTLNTTPRVVSLPDDHFFHEWWELPSAARWHPRWLMVVGGGALLAGLAIGRWRGEIGGGK